MLALPVLPGVLQDRITKLSVVQYLSCGGCGVEDGHPGRHARAQLLVCQLGQLRQGHLLLQGQPHLQQKEDATGSAGLLVPWRRLV